MPNRFIQLNYLKNMFKFLVYLFIFYTASRFIFGTLLNFKKSNNIQDLPNNYQDEEVKIKAKKATSSTINNNKKTNSNLGEYVDFEEIK